MIAEAIGLTREQFTHVMLLPTGRVRAVLRSSDDIRRALLTKLFCTSLYDTITDELYARRTAATRARERAGQDIGEAVSAAAEAAGLDAAERAGLLAAPRADRQTRLKELADELAQATAGTKEALKAATAAVAAARAESDDAALQARLAGRLTQASPACARTRTPGRPRAASRHAGRGQARRAGPAAARGARRGRRRHPRDHARMWLDLLPGADGDSLAGGAEMPPPGRARAADAEAAALAARRRCERDLPAQEAELATWRARRPRRRHGSPRSTGHNRICPSASPRWKPGSRRPPRPRLR